MIFRRGYCGPLSRIICNMLQGRHVCAHLNNRMLPRMTDHRPLAVKLIAEYFCLKAVLLTIAVAIVYTSPEIKPAENDFISLLAPIVPEHIGRIGVLFALPFALVRLVIGLGIWFMKKWARMIIVLDLSWAFCSAGIGLATSISFDHKLPQLPSSSPYLPIDILISILILFYLFDPDVKRAFGVRD